MLAKGSPDIVFTEFADVVAVRSIAIGVLMLERHDILEYTHIIPRNSEEDVVTVTGNAYGAYYLCIGLLFESMMMTFHVPGRFVTGAIADIVIISIGALLSSITFLASIALVGSYLRIGLTNKRR